MGRLLLITALTAALAGCSPPAGRDGPTPPHTLARADCLRLARAYGRFAPVARELCADTATGRREACVVRETVVCSSSTADGR